MNSLRRIKPRNDRLLLPSKLFHSQNFFKEKTIVTNKKSYLDNMFKNSVKIGNKTTINQNPFEKGESTNLRPNKTQKELNSDFKKTFCFTLEQLLILKTIILSGSFKKTAELLFLSQPAVSLQIKKLENQLNLTLFERKHKNLHLTLSGTIFLCYIDRILFLCEEISKILEEPNYFKLKNFPPQKTKNLTGKITFPLEKRDKKNLYFLSSIISKNEKNEIDSSVFVHPSLKIQSDKEIFCKRILNVLELRINFNLQVYTLGDSSLFFLDLAKESFFDNDSFANILKKTKLILFTDNLFLPFENEGNFSDYNFKTLLKEFGSIVEVSTLKSLKFCLKTKLGNAFIIKHSLLKAFPILKS